MPASRHNPRTAREPFGLEPLEDRRLLSVSPMAISVHYQATNLISGDAGLAPVHDINSVNAWGMANSARGPFFIANEGSGIVTRYEGIGQQESYAFTVPNAAGTGVGSPTGIVYYDGAGFKVTNQGITAPSRFITVSLDGVIAGWSGRGNLQRSLLRVNHSSQGAVYTGATLGTNGNNRFLYVANFHSGAIEVYNTRFQQVKMRDAFQDAQVPSNYAPYNIQNIDGRLYVAFSKKTANGEEVSGTGVGMIDVFNTNGRLVRRFASGGPLASPWAMTKFEFAGRESLVVGNNGNGKVSVFDLSSSKFRGNLTQTDGSAVVVDELRGLSQGNGNIAGPTGTLFFTSGPEEEATGLFGVLTAES